MQEAREKGYNAAQQTRLGLASAATEYVTEKLFPGNPAYDKDRGLVNKFVERLTGSGKLTAALSTLPGRIVSEGLEEVAADVIDPIAEVAMTGNWTGYDIGQMAHDGVVGMALGGLGQGGQYIAGKVRGALGQNVGETQKSATSEAAAKAAQAVEELGAKPSEAKTVVEPNRLPGYGEQDVARQEQLRTAERIAQKFGAELEVAELPNGVDGEYLDGKIIISPRAANPVMTVAVHELTHHMESSGRYGEFSRMVLDYVSNEMGVDVDTMKNAIRSEYAKGGFALDDVGAERELVAKFAESKLFQDEAAINRLARTNRSMFQTVKDWISDMVVKLTGTEEEKFFRNAERLYEKALREVGDGTNTNGGQVQYSMGDVDLQRNVIDYTDQAAQLSAISDAMQRQVSENKVVPVTAEEINAHQTGTDWSAVKKARKWVKDAVSAFMGGDSVFFKMENGVLEAYLTKTANNHYAFFPSAENATYAYSSENDTHSIAGSNVQANIWDYFVCPVDYGKGPEPFVFCIRSIDEDVRAQIYAMITQKKRGAYLPR